MTPIFYTLPENIGEAELTIIGEEAHHISRVMRLKRGEPVMVVDGVGNGYKAEIMEIAPRIVTCSIYSRIRNFGEPLHRVTLAAGLSTGVKFDDVIQRATELGVSRFIPLVTEKSKVRLDEEMKGQKKLDRWRKVAIASIKQCGRSLIPAIEPIIEFEKIFTDYSDLGHIFLLDPGGNRRIEDLSFASEERGISIMIGPESGFARSEVESGREKGAEIITLGGRVLRTENAGPTAVALLMSLLGEFR
jgi:16S rRNA (uracil1498-N3)-methyltransferase